LRFNIKYTAVMTRPAPLNPSAAILLNMLVSNCAICSFNSETLASRRGIVINCDDLTSTSMASANAIACGMVKFADSRIFKVLTCILMDNMGFG
jgi:hypothetical protein